MRVLALTLLLMSCHPVYADHVRNTDVLNGLALAMRAPCTVNETGQAGLCELYYDSEGTPWLAFFDRPHHVLWVRTKEEDGYRYLFRDLGDHI